MIRLFRKIRSKLLSEERYPIYLLYASGEIVLVVAGILLALQIDNWNEQRQLRDLETKYLKEIQNNLELDLGDIDHSLEFTERKIRSNSIVLQFLENKWPYQDSLSFHLAQLAGSLHFTPHTNAIEGLKYEGISILRNDSLRNTITDLYDYLYGHIIYLETEDDHRFQYDVLYPQLIANLTVIRPWREAVPNNYDQLLTSTQFRSAISTNLWYRRYLHSEYTVQKERVTEVIHLIEEEIEKNSKK